MPYRIGLRMQQVDLAGRVIALCHGDRSNPARATVTEIRLANHAAMQGAHRNV